MHFCHIAHMGKPSFYYNMIYKCPGQASTTITSALRTQCESRDVRSVASLMPVTDPGSGIIYRNVFCSQCHGVVGVVPWAASFHCPIRMLQTNEFGDVASVDRLFTGLCEMYLTPVPTQGLNPGADRCYNNLYYDTCNKTGRWRPKGGSELVIHACAVSRTPHYPYANVYCAICNGAALPQNGTCQRPGQTSVSPTSFTAALRFDYEALDDAKPEAETEKEDICPWGFVMDTYKETCRRVFCPQLQRLVNGRCEKILTNYGNMKTFLVLKLEADDMELFFDQSLKTKTAMARDYLKFLTEDRRDLTVILRELAETAAIFPGTPYLTVLATVFAQSSTDEDILQFIHSRLERSFAYTTPDGQIFRFSVSLNAGILIGYMDYRANTLTDRLGTALKELEFNSTLESLYQRQIVSGEFIGVLFSKLLFCQQASLNQTEYVDLGSRIVLTTSNKTLYTFEFIKNGRTSEIRVCIDDYLQEASAGQNDDGYRRLQPVILYVLVSLVALVLSAGVCIAAAMCRRRRFSGTFESFNASYRRDHDTISK